MNNEIEKPRPEQKGVSRKTLDALAANALDMRWRSIKDESLRDIVKHTSEKLPRFEKDSWQEVRAIIDLFEENQKKKSADILKQELSLDIKGKIRLGNQYAPSVPIKFAPIFDTFAQRIIALMVGNRYSEIPKMSSKQRAVIQDNLDVLKILYGFEPKEPW